MAGMLKFFAKDKRVNSGVARGVGWGWGAPPRVSRFVFFSFETENPLIGRQRSFFFFWSSHTFGLKIEHQLVLQRRPFFFFFFFFLFFTYILANKGCHHEIATILSDASEGEKCLKIKLKEIVKFST